MVGFGRVKHERVEGVTTWGGWNDTCEVIDPPGLYRIKIKAGMRMEEALAEAQLSVGVEKQSRTACFQMIRCRQFIDENPVV